MKNTFYSDYDISGNSARYKKYFLNLFLGILDIVILVFIIVFPLMSVLGGANKLSSLKTDLLLFENERRSFEEAKNDLERGLVKIDKTNDLFVLEKAPVDFIGFLEESSEDSGFQIEINPAGASKLKNDPLSSIAFTVSGKGEGESFLRFLDKVENSPYLMRILDLSVNKVKASSPAAVEEPLTDRIEAKFTVKVYTK